MSCKKVHIDIANYIKLSIREKLIKEELHVGDSHNTLRNNTGLN